MAKLSVRIRKTKAGHSMTTQRCQYFPETAWLCNKSTVTVPNRQPGQAHHTPFFPWTIPICLISSTFSQKRLGGESASSKSCSHSQGEMALSISIQDPGDAVRSGSILVYWKTKMSYEEKRKLELEGKSFVYPSIPQKVKDRPAGAISTCFLCSELLSWMLSLLRLEKEEARKRKIAMNISCSASADFLVP